MTSAGLWQLPVGCLLCYVKAVPGRGRFPGSTLCNLEVVLGRITGQRNCCSGQGESSDLGLQVGSCWALVLGHDGLPCPQHFVTHSAQPVPLPQQLPCGLASSLTASE